MKTIISALALCASLFLLLPTAHADPFGSGANAFDVDFVTIGNPGNADDTTGNPNPVGQVDTTYRIGQFEISEDMIDKANAIGGLGITHNNRGANKPATSISWFEAAQFVNWLNTASGSTPAYKFDTGGNFQLWQSSDAGFNPNNLYRNSQARYFLPSVDEWYKAAYYDPTGGVYYNDPTGSDSVPDGIDFPDAPFDAVFVDGNNGAGAGPNDITDVGLSSPYGTAGQGGNVFEWEETSFDLMNDSSSSLRSFRGGSWATVSFGLVASFRNKRLPSDEVTGIGFRVASIPEPSTLLLGTLASMGLLMRRRCLS